MTSLTAQKASTKIPIIEIFYQQYYDDFRISIYFRFDLSQLPVNFHSVEKLNGLLNKKIEGISVEIRFWKNHIWFY